MHLSPELSCQTYSAKKEASSHGAQSRDAVVPQRVGGGTGSGPRADCSKELRLLSDILAPIPQTLSESQWQITTILQRPGASRDFYYHLELFISKSVRSKSYTVENKVQATCLHQSYNYLVNTSVSFWPW